MLAMANISAARKRHPEIMKSSSFVEQNKLPKDQVVPLIFLLTADAPSSHGDCGLLLLLANRLQIRTVCLPSGGPNATRRPHIHLQEGLDRGI
ncbi:hypothetical protein DPX16_3896 [Anabarilius grahami]|uniref:Uncharacterized protein n=1 Tax=Anabarilius grahami TaxID=495550 RepID=A0A3N0Z8Q7_ANAGA|nr:hypothetical protein DPX16_3896 [Anabarilius grahami]